MSAQQVRNSLIQFSQVLLTEIPIVQTQPVQIRNQTIGLTLIRNQQIGNSLVRNQQLRSTDINTVLVQNQQIQTQQIRNFS